jgi:hypothetical protein
MQGISNMMRLHTWVVLAASLAFAGLPGLARQAAAQEVSVDYGSGQTWVGEPTQVTFTIRNASDVGTPVLPSVDGLKIEYSGARNTSSSITIINGVRSESRSMAVAIEITPERPGKFEVPPIRIDVDGTTLETESFTFKAVEASNDGRLIVDVIRAGGPVYIGEPVELKLRIWVKRFYSARYDTTVNESTMWRLIKSNSEWGPFAESLDQLARAGRRPAGKEVTRAEGDYYLYEMTRQIRPTGSGLVDELEDVTIRISYPTGLTENRTRSIFRRSDLSFSGLMPISERALVKGIDVKPLPEEGRPEDFRGAVGDFIVRAGARPTDVAVGDPITLTLLVGSVDSDPTVLQTLRPPPLADIPELTESFRIPRDPIAGEVEDTIKVFTQTLRPLSDEITEIPPIPFSFFDPAREEYRTVYTRAIPIQVSPAETLAASDIVRSGGETATLANEDGDPIGDADAGPAGLRPNFQIGSHMMASTSRDLGMGTIALTTLPPAGFVALALVAGRRRWKHAHPAAVRSRRAGRRARIDLRRSEGLSDLDRVLRSYICDRTGRPNASLTSNEAIRLAREAGADAPTVAGMDELFRASERAGYGGMHDAPDQQVKVASELIHALERCRWNTPEEVTR